MKKILSVFLLTLVFGCSSNSKEYDEVKIVDENYAIMNGSAEEIDLFNDYSLNKLEDHAQNIVVVKALNKITDKNSVDPNNTFKSIDEMVETYESDKALSFFMSKVEVISSSKGDLKKGDIIYVLYHTYVRERVLTVAMADFDIPINEGEKGVLFLTKNTDDDLKQNYINAAADIDDGYKDEDFYYTSLKKYSSIAFKLEDNVYKDNLVKEIINKYNK